MNGHIDVVSSGDEAAWASPPFAPEVRDGRELGEDFFARRDGERAKQRHLRALERLGHHVTVETAPGHKAA